MDTRTVYVVTGCSPGGIGHGLAVELAKHPGNVVVATLRSPDKIDGDDALRTRHVSSALVEVLELDVQDEQQSAAVVRRIAQAHGKIDVLVNVAGVTLFGPAAELSLKDARKVFDTNYFGVVNMVRQVFPYMADRHSGRIINVGSVVAWLAPPWFSHYAASKAALHTYNDALRAEVAPFGIEVVTVAPGSIESSMQDNMRDLLKISPGSYFAALRPKIDGFLQAAGVKTTPTSEFVKQLAALVQRRQRMPAEWRAGALSTMVWLSSWVPRWIMAWIKARVLVGMGDALGRWTAPVKAVLQDEDKGGGDDDDDDAKSKQ
ncbi:hypothetical protein RI367_007730 [Sorochytrium milnesiophthora]